MDALTNEGTMTDLAAAAVTATAVRESGLNPIASSGHNSGILMWDKQNIAKLNAKAVRDAIPPQCLGEQASFFLESISENSGELLKKMNGARTMTDAVTTFNRSYVITSDPSNPAVVVRGEEILAGYR